MAKNWNRLRIVAAGLVSACVWSGIAHGQAVTAVIPGPSKCQAGSAPTPADPYPLNAAGWGAEAGRGLQASRWAEDWTCLRQAGKAPTFKAIPLGETASLTLSTETRLRYDMYNNAQLGRGVNYEQGLLRGIVGADLRLNPSLRFYGEIGTGQVAGRSHTASPSLHNRVSLQQMFVDVRGNIGTVMVGAMIGRQEFADGPRQLVSLGDGSNLHRTWNGTRLYAHGRRVRFGAFAFGATQLGRGSFDEKVSHERLYGLNASLIVSPAKSPNIYLDPFWIHSENPALSSGGHVGLDDRDTFGARLWGQQGNFRYDWTLARQTGDYMNRPIDAWGAFAVQSLALSGKGWKPRLTSRIDIASGGGAYGTGTVKGFNSLYASSNYLGDGRFLSLNNLLLVAPGISVAPTATTTLSFEYGFARRLDTHDAAYGGGMRPYAGTQNLPGHDMGRLLRASGSYAVNDHLTVNFDYERFDVGKVLKQAHLPSGSFTYIGSTFRY